MKGTGCGSRREKRLNKKAVEKQTQEGEGKIPTGSGVGSRETNKKRLTTKKEKIDKYLRDTANQSP